MQEFIVNSRIHKVSETTDEIRKYFPDSQIHLTQHAGQATQLASEATQRSDNIVAVGGDGTINEVLNGLMHCKSSNMPSLGILPRGSANDFAQAQGIPGTIEELYQLHAKQSLKPVDVGQVKSGSFEKFFLNVADIGFGAEVVKTLGSKSRLFPGISYLSAITRVFLRYNAIEMELSTPDINWSGKAYGIFIANSTQLGRGIKIALDAKIDDGEFTVVIVGDVSTFEYISVVNRLKNGKHHGSNKITTLHAKSLQVNCPEGCAAEADGELMGDLPVSVQILPSRIRLLCP